MCSIWWLLIKLLLMFIMLPTCMQSKPTQLMFKIGRFAKWLPWYCVRSFKSLVFDVYSKQAMDRWNRKDRTPQEWPRHLILLLVSTEMHSYTTIQSRLILCGVEARSFLFLRIKRDPWYLIIISLNSERKMISGNEQNNESSAAAFFWYHFLVFWNKSKANHGSASVSSSRTVQSKHLGEKEKIKNDSTHETKHYHLHSQNRAGLSRYSFPLSLSDFSDVVLRFLLRTHTPTNPICSSRWSARTDSLFNNQKHHFHFRHHRIDKNSTRCYINQRTILSPLGKRDQWE